MGSSRTFGCGTYFARPACMALMKQVSQYARGRLVRRLSRSMPWIGAVVAIAVIGTAIRRKGLFGGALDTALDVTPGVGAVKNALEAIRGRDFIKDKRVVR
jgi:putative toxin of predicted polymorphic toxin system